MLLSKWFRFSHRFRILPVPSPDYYYIAPWKYFTPALANGFPWCPSESKSPQVARTLLNILSDCSLDGLSSSSYPQLFSFLTKLLGIVPSAPITIGITATFMFNDFDFHSFAYYIDIVLVVYLFYEKNIYDK